MKIKEPLTYPTDKGYTMEVTIRRLLEPIPAFECECCGKHVKRAGKFEYRSPQYVRDHMPSKLIVCRNCVYKLAFATKGIMVKKRNNIIENASNNYASIN